MKTKNLRALIAVRYASCDLSPYRDGAGNLPPGWPNWLRHIENAWDLDKAASNGWVVPAALQPRLEADGRAALSSAGYPEKTSFKEFWDWFLKLPGPPGRRKRR